MAGFRISGKVGVIGVGVMGSTLIKAMLNQGIVQADKLWAAARTEDSAIKTSDELGIAVTTDYTSQLADTKVVLLCVKPYTIPDVLTHLKESGIAADVLIISIAAGKTLQQIEEGIVTPNPVIRAMPNTPCVVGEGMTAVCGGSFAKKEHLDVAKGIFESVGQCIELQEHHFDAVTGLCGSGPAYLYLIMESLADGGVRVGLPRSVATQIVAQTVLGAATMVRDSGRHPASLRDDVTTPAGCTIAGLLTLEDGRIRSVLARCVEEATNTARGLGTQKH